MIDLTLTLDDKAHRLLHHIATLTDCDVRDLAAKLFYDALEAEARQLDELLHAPEHEPVDYSTPPGDLLDPHLMAALEQELTSGKVYDQIPSTLPGSIPPAPSSTTPDEYAHWLKNRTSSEDNYMPPANAYPPAPPSPHQPPATEPPLTH